MTTVLFFQELAWIAVELCIDCNTKYPKAQWRFANNLSVPSHVSVAAWNNAFESWYGLNR